MENFQKRIFAAFCMVWRQVTRLVTRKVNQDPGPDLGVGNVDGHVGRHGTFLGAAFALGKLGKSFPLNLFFFTFLLKYLLQMLCYMAPFE